MEWNGSQLMKWSEIWEVACNSWYVLFNCRKTSKFKNLEWKWGGPWSEMNEVWMNEWYGVWMDEMRWIISEMNLHLWFCNNYLQKEQIWKYRVSERFWFSLHLFCINMSISDWFSCLYFILFLFLFLFSISDLRKFT